MRGDFFALAHTGRAVHKAGWDDLPVVVDLASLTVPQRLPVLRGHDTRDVVGETRRIAVAGGLVVEGSLTEDVDDTFTPSIGFDSQSCQRERIEAGAHVRVNGHDFAGPLWVVRGATLDEVSLCPRAVDANAFIRATTRTDIVTVAEAAAPPIVCVAQGGTPTPSPSLAASDYYLTDWIDAARAAELLACLDRHGTGYLLRRLDDGRRMVLTDIDLTGHFPGRSLDAHTAEAIDAVLTAQGATVHGEWASA